MIGVAAELGLLKRASFGENSCFVFKRSRWERMPMNYSTCLVALVASAIGPLVEKLNDGWTPVLQEIEQLVGSFFTTRAIADRRVEIRR
jgi:hypothetical protein